MADRFTEEVKDFLVCNKCNDIHDPVSTDATKLEIKSFKFLHSWHFTETDTHVVCMFCNHRISKSRFFIKKWAFLAKHKHNPDLRTELSVVITRCKECPQWVTSLEGGEDAFKKRHEGEHFTCKACYMNEPKAGHKCHTIVIPRIGPM